MPDNPDLIATDRRTVSDQPHEINHLIEALQKEFPAASREQIKRAIDIAKSTSGASEARERVTATARAYLKKGQTQ